MRAALRVTQRQTWAPGWWWRCPQSHNVTGDGFSKLIRWVPAARLAAEHEGAVRLEPRLGAPLAETASDRRLQRAQGVPLQNDYTQIGTGALCDLCEQGEVRVAHEPVLPVLGGIAAWARTTTPNNRGRFNPGQTSDLPLVAQ